MRAALVISARENQRPGTCQRTRVENWRAATTRPSSHRILSSLGAEKDQHMGIPKFDTAAILIDPQDDGVA